MKKKGFTLIELLAVIVVLAVIALITTPVILGVIEKAKKGAFKNSVYGLIESTNIYIAENLDAGNISFICNGKDCITENDNKLSFKGNVPKSGSIKVDKQHIEVEYITDGTYCAYGTLEDLIIDKGCANIDITKPEIDESKLIISSTTSSISIRILEGFAIDPESGVKEYRVTLNGETKTLKEIGSLTFEGLEKNRSYPIKIEVENGKGLIVEVKKESSTLDFENPTITLTNTPTTAVNGYLKSQVAKVTYNSTNITSPQYYVKTTRVGTSSVAVTKTCGTGTIPSTCTSVTSTTTLSANTWYQVSGNVNVTYSTAASETATIYAITYDGTNYSGASTGTISKIDTTGPTITLGSPSIKTDSITIPITTSDSESGVNTPTCKYGTTSGNYTTNASNVSTTGCSIKGLTANTTYYYQVCVSDKVGNSTCKTGNNNTASVTNPTITLTNTPTTAVNGYLKSQVAKVTYNSTNISSPRYFIKTTRAGTSSVAVTKTCGTGTAPSTCTSVTSTTTLSANTWYQVSGNVNVTYSTASSATATIYASIYDGTNYRASTATISKIDTTAPSVPSIQYNGGSNTCSWKNNYNITLSSTDSGSGIDHYEIDLDGNGTSDGNVSANYIPANGVHSHNVKFRAVDKLGNTSGWTAAQHIHMDTAAPGVTGITYNSGSNTCSWKNNYNLTLSANDNVGIAYYEIDWTGDGAANRTTAANFIPWNGYSSCNTRFRAVDHAGNRGAWSAVQHIHMDTTSPTITFTRTITTNQDTDNIYSVTYGASGGSISCQNVTFNNNSVTTFASMKAIGTSTVKCTAVSNSGNVTVKSANITLTGVFNASDTWLGVTNGAYRNNGTIILPADTSSGYHPPFQYGPYLNVTPGCYHVFYFGNNLNASPSGYDVVQTISGVQQALPIYSLNYVSSDSNYNFKVTNNINNLELRLRNLSSSVITITKITVEPAPSSWCS